MKFLTQDCTSATSKTVTSDKLEKDGIKKFYRKESYKISLGKRHTPALLQFDLVPTIN